MIGIAKQRGLFIFKGLIRFHWCKKDCRIQIINSKITVLHNYLSLCFYNPPWTSCDFYMDQKYVSIDKLVTTDIKRKRYPDQKKKREKENDIIFTIEWILATLYFKQ